MKTRWQERAEILRRGQCTSIVRRVGDRDDSPLSFSVPTHVAERNHRTIGDRATVSLLRAALHHMPWDGLDQ